MKRTSQPHYYQAEVENFLHALANPDAVQNSVKTASEEAKTYGALHPIAIGAAMIDSQRFGDEKTDPKTKTKLKEILKKSFPVDEVTGLYAKHTLPLILGFAHRQALADDTMPICYVEGDFRNLGGCNGKFTNPGRNEDGHQVTDKLLHRVCEIFKDSFDGKAEVHGVRAGGDEIGFALYGITKEQVNKILEEKVYPQVHLLAAQFGVEDLKHLKSLKLPGFGVSFGAVELGGPLTEAGLRNKMDAEIQRRKHIDGYLALSLTDTAAVDRYMNEDYLPQLREKLKKDLKKTGRLNELETKLKLEADSTRTGLIAHAVPETQALWGKLISAGGAYHGMAGVENGVTPKEFFAAQKLSAAAQEAALKNIQLSPKLSSSEKIPFNDQDLPLRRASSNVDSPEIVRLRRALAAFDFNEMASADEPFTWQVKERKFTQNVPPVAMNDRPHLRDMVVNLMGIFDAHDHASRCKTGALIVEDLQGLIETFSDPKERMKIAHMELTNLGGLNNVSRDLADAVLRETTKHINTLINTGKTEDHYLADHVYHDEGNGNFKIFFTPSYRSEVIPGYLRRNIARKIKEEIGDKSILDFARATYAHRPNEPTQIDILEQENKIAALRSSIAKVFEIGNPHDAEVDKKKMSDIPNLKSENVRLGIVTKGFYLKDTETGEKAAEEALKRIGRQIDSNRQQQVNRQR